MEDIQDMPPANLRFMGEDEVTFLKNGENLLAPVLGRFDMNGTVLDIGCGYGRLAYALRRAGFRGQYVGLDILPLQINWLRDNFQGPNYSFVHMDIVNDRYNPNGKLTMAELALPALETPPTLVLMLSVFTHLYKEDVLHFLSSVAKVTDSRTLFYSTWFLLNDHQREMEQAGASPYPMTHALPPESRYFNAEDPLHAIGHDEAAVRAWGRDAGFWPAEVRYGSWCGRTNPDAYQDVLFWRR